MASACGLGEDTAGFGRKDGGPREVGGGGCGFQLGGGRGLLSRGGPEVEEKVLLLTPGDKGQSSSS